MPKYLATASFTPESLRALREGGAAERVANGHALAASVGGTMECFYFAFGDKDAYAIFEFDGDETAAAASLTANMAGAAHIWITKLLTAAEVDAAFARTVAYRPPGA